MLQTQKYSNRYGLSRDHIFAQPGGIRIDYKRNQKYERLEISQILHDNPGSSLRG